MEFYLSLEKKIFLAQAHAKARAWQARACQAHALARAPACAQARTPARAWQAHAWARV